MQVLDYSEKWGKDVEEAVRLALIDLKCDKEQVKITVLEEPSRGFLGFGAKLAKVRVELLQKEKAKEEKVAVKEEKVVAKDEKVVFEETAMQAKDPVLPGAEIKVPINVRENRDVRRPGKDRRPPREDNGSSTQATRGNKEAQENPKNEYNFASTENEARRLRYKKKEMGVSKFSVAEGEEGATPVTDGLAVGFLAEMTEKMGLDLDIRAFEKDNVLYVSAEGKDAGTIIGKRGQTLDAVQYLTSLVVNKDREKYLRVIVNAENYREKREKTLEQLAERLSDKVTSTGKSVRLEPMNPYERKVIHSTLQKNNAVTTRSEGEEPYRRVIIEMKR